MSTKQTQAEAAAYARGRADGAAIVKLPEAKGRRDAAVLLAANPSVMPEDAAKMLATMPGSGKPKFDTATPTQGEPGFGANVDRELKRLNSPRR